MLPILWIVPPVLPSASATTLRVESSIDRLRRSDVLAEGIVMSKEHTLRRLDGEDVAITLFEVEVTSVLLGHIESSSVRIVLPGGPHEDGSWAIVAGTPELEVGELILFNGIFNDFSDVMITGFSDGVFRSTQRDDGSLVVVDHQGDPVVYWGCEMKGHAVVSLPNESPAFDDYSDFGVSYTDVPIADAMDWDFLIESFDQCVASMGGGVR